MTYHHHTHPIHRQPTCPPAPPPTTITNRGKNGNRLRLPAEERPVLRSATAFPCGFVSPCRSVSSVRSVLNFVVRQRRQPRKRGGAREKLATFGHTLWPASIHLLWAIGA